MRKLLLLALMFIVTPVAVAQSLTIAAASDLSSVFPEIAKRFEAKTGTHIKLTFGSSGNLVQQIQNGAPFDIFLSADTRYPQTLEQNGFAEPGSKFNYALGKIVLFVPNSSKLNLNQGPRLLLSPEVKKIAIGNPLHAPYGRAAEEALKKEGLYDQVKHKLVIGENISQAAQYVGTGNTDAGIIALSLAIPMKDRGRYIEMPLGDYAPIRQTALIFTRCKHKQTAKAFFEFLKTPAVRNLLVAYGYSMPD